jgi:hypothetical protein
MLIYFILLTLHKDTGNLLEARRRRMGDESYLIKSPPQARHINNYRRRRATIMNDRSNCGHGSIKSAAGEWG